jgi:hypothetical protein
VTTLVWVVVRHVHYEDDGLVVAVRSSEELARQAIEEERTAPYQGWTGDYYEIQCHEVDGGAVGEQVRVEGR